MKVDNNRLLCIIHDQYDTLEAMDPTDPDYEGVMNALKLSYDIKNQDEKTHHDTVSSYIKVGGEVGLGAISAGMTYVMLKRGFKFEETGTFQSSTFKNLFRSLKH